LSVNSTGYKQNYPNSCEAASWNDGSVSPHLEKQLSRFPLHLDV
jgi:hypothetical protein